MTVDTDMILYMPYINKDLSEQNLKDCIIDLNIGNIKNLKVTQGILYNTAIIEIEWNINKHTESIQNLINSSNKYFNIYHSNGNEYKIFNINKLSALQSIEKYPEKHFNLSDLNILKNSSCCGQISGAWQPSYPSI